MVALRHAFHVMRSRIGKEGEIEGAIPPRLASRTNGSLKITLEDVAAGDKYTVGVHTYRAERDGKSIDQRSVLVFSISGDKVTEVFEMHEDTAKTDSFWS